MLLLGLPGAAQACLQGNYERLSYKCRDDSSIGASYSLLRVVFSTTASPRQIAIIAGVSEYPNLPQSMQLPPALHDVDMLSRVLDEQYDFDEIIVLLNEDFNNDNLRHIFQRYLPDQLINHPGSRVLFAFSGHGADFDDAGYVFFSSTHTIDPHNYADLDNAISLNVLKEYLRPTVFHAHHFLALINSCYGGSFLNSQAWVFSGAPSTLEAKAAHGITAGGAAERVWARSNVGTGKGSVFFEMAIAALKGQSVNLAGQTIPSPARDGILTVTNLANFLHETVQIIEDYGVRPLMGSLRPSQVGIEGEFFFITDRELARQSLAQRFPRQYESVFGAEQDSGTASYLLTGFELPPADVNAEFPDLIPEELADGKDYTIVNDDFWERTTVLESSLWLSEPRAVFVDGNLYILFLEYALDRNLSLLEYNVGSGEERIVDRVENGTSCWLDQRNLQIVGLRIYYYLGCNAPTMTYRIGSGDLPQVSSGIYLDSAESASWFPTATSRDGRYMVTAFAAWHDSVWDLMPDDYRMAIGWIGKDQRPAFLRNNSGIENEITGLNVYDRFSDSRSILFRQPYTGDWSIGVIVWSHDGDKIYFDNSGGVACIWLYDLRERVLRKIVPEHSALQPYPFIYEGEEHIIYLETVLRDGSEVSLLRIARERRN